MGRFDHRIAVVTGASSGIGRATAARLADEGATVVAAARSTAALEQLAAAGPAGRIVPQPLDVRDSGAVRDLVGAVAARHGGIDVLVNCAGTARLDPVLDIDEAHWQDTLQTNLTGAFVASQAAARHMADAGGGAIVNVASIDAFVADSPAVHYCVSKAGVVAMTRGFAHELGHLGIRTNAVAPGLTATPMTMDESWDRIAGVYRERIPMRRPSTAEEQAAVICFLASDDAAYVNGETVIVDGGLLTGMWYDPRDAPA
ncbi:MAG TPA: SDR family oxidoreductase [Gaiellales bacterium]|jgi:NAD(P)-dependent dehydrogenase (short-subunit alcohol dehydrogenase family)